MPKISGKNPDFVNIKKRLIIEYNGHPFSHTPERDKEKTEHYERYGWKTLNLTPTDLKDERALLTKIDKFNCRKNLLVPYIKIKVD